MDATILSLAGGLTTPLEYRPGDTPASFDPVDYCLPCVEVTEERWSEHPVILLRLYWTEFGAAPMTLEEAARVYAALGDLLQRHSVTNPA